MSHTGNWNRNPRKIALETARAREEIARQEASPPRAVVFEFFPPTLETSHACYAAGRDWSVTATCTCGRRRWIDVKALLSTYLAHAPWPRVMQSMVCEDCSGQPVLLAFDTAPAGVDMSRRPFGHIRVSAASS